MIRANVRSGLGRNDAQLALRLIAQGSQAEYDRCEAALRDRGLDVLLDDPRLFRAMLQSEQAVVSSYPLLAYVVVRHALQAAGERDPVLADYASSVLMHFGMRDRSQRVSPSDDQTYDTVAELAGDSEGPDVRRNFLVLAHLGNYSLWLSGIFPDYISHRKWRRGGPDLEYYEEMGRRGFSLAAAHRLAAEQGVAELLNLVGEKFLVLRIALNSVSDTLLFPQVNSPDRLMRHVSDEARWRHQSRPEH